MENPNQIIKEISKKYGITIEQLMGKDRSNWFVRARVEAIKRMRNELDLSFPDIGRYLGKRNHATIIYNYYKKNI